MAAHKKKKASAKANNDNAEFLPHEEPSDSDADSLAMDVVADELDLGETEIVNTDGSVSVQRSKKLNDEEKAAEEARIATDTVNDPQYEVHKKKAAVRMKRIEAKFKAEAKMTDQAILSFGDEESMKGVPSKFTKIVPCKKGNLKQERGNGSRKRLRKMTTSEREAEDAQIDDADPCECEVCSSRRDFAGREIQELPVGLRSGKKRTWGEKYGPGHTL